MTASARSGVIGHDHQQGHGETVTVVMNGIEAVHRRKVLKYLAGDRGYFRYLGSLTTPPCSQKVIRSVFNSPVEI